MQKIIKKYIQNYTCKLKMNLRVILCQILDKSILMLFIFGSFCTIKKIKNYFARKTVWT
jgi:hypothetical protein